MDDQRNKGEKQEHVDQKTGHMVDEESTGPKQKQNHEQSQKSADFHPSLHPLVLLSGSTRPLYHRPADRPELKSCAGAATGLRWATLPRSSAKGTS